MIKVKDNVANTKQLNKALDYINKANWSYGWPSNTDMPYGHWNADFTRTPKNNPTDVSSIIPPDLLSIWHEVNNQFFNGQARLVRCYANRHTFGTEGYIHTDTQRKEDQTCVVYMDKVWEADWGGETAFYDKNITEIVKSVIPKFGRAAVFAGDIPHCAKPISRICPKVRTTLMFKVTIDPKAVYQSEELLTEFLTEIGADTLPHKRGSLADHLLRTYHLLKAVGAGDILALAGGLHSVYGTSTFKYNLLDDDSRLIASRFGSEVERLVRLFSIQDRPNTLENPDGSLSDLDLFLLRSIECANLHDQAELTAEVYPNLYAFAKKFGNYRG
jgi:SM-20-related protein